MQTDVKYTITEVYTMITHYSLQVIGGILILIAGWLIAKWTGKLIRKGLERNKKIDPILIPILAKTAKITVLIFTAIAVLSNFGIQTASFIAVLGAAGLAIGLALQGTLSNIASGMMLLVFRPFTLKDYVTIDGKSLIVDEIGLFLSRFHTFDNINVYLPNSKIWGGEICNYSQNDTRRVDMAFGIGYKDNMDKAMDLIREVMKADERTLEDPEPFVAVSELADSAVNIIARAWTKSGDVFQTKLDLTKRVKERFDQEGINIPYPQRDVHLFKDNQKNES